MNRIFMSALLVLGFIGCIGANGDSEGQLKVRPLSEKNITLHRDRIISQEDTRTMFRNLAIGTAVVGAGYMVHSWMKGPNMHQPTPLGAHANLAQRVRDLEESNERLEDDVLQFNGGQRPAQSWTSWFKDCGKWATNFAYTLTPSLIWGLGRSYMVGEVSRFVFPSLPTIGNYLGENKSMTWCVFKRTNFFGSLVGVMNWTKNVALDPENPQHRKELAVCSNVFINEMEKVIGYMGYVLEELDDEKHAVYKERGMVTIETIATEVQGLVAFINRFNALKSHSEDDMLNMIGFVKKSLFSLICHMENFKMVSIQAKLEDQEAPDIFNDTLTAHGLSQGLKGFVFPEFQHLSPQATGLDQESEFIRKTLTQIADQYI